LFEGVGEALLENLRKQFKESQAKYLLRNFSVETRCFSPSISSLSAAMSIKIAKAFLPYDERS
jgi:hypothetical protein